MSQDWFVVRAGKELGPFTAKQLREMAATHNLVPDDLVRRADMKEARKASSIRGLFPDSTAPVAKNVEAEGKPPEDQQDSQPKRKLPLTFLVSVGVIFLACCGGLGVIGHRMKQSANAQLAEADAQWNKGDRAPALAKYRKLLDSPRLLDEHDRPRVYGRAIDGDYERGDTAAGKALIELADKEGVVPAISHPDAKIVVTAIQAEKARVEAEKVRVEAEKSEKKRLAEAKKKDDERVAKMTPQERLKEAKWDDVVSAQTLYNEYDSNEIAAKDEYGGKTIKVEGEVEKVEGGGLLGSDKILLRGRTGYAVRCALSGGTNDLKKLQAGSWVRVEGRCDGKARSGVVEMSKCIFVLVNR